ncbi:MAG: sulfite oxidase-like oxidoreductase [Planctomycetaceae bacterium]|nr:sulfite oxidase-like oxidoreductase [Planctomycetaceae bacterium]
MSEPKYQEGAAPEPVGLPDDIIISPDTLRENRIPPNQTRTRKWPVLQAGHVMHISPEEWQLSVTGLVERPAVLSWEEFRSLPRVRVFADFHCVTRWSRLGNLWEGVSTRTIAAWAGVLPAARFVLPGAYDHGWSTNLPLADFLAEDALLCDTHDGQPLDADHGGPVRLIVPLLYAWKSAKWLQSLAFSAEDSPGHWEQAGYHNHGDPWREERFGSDTIPPGYYD